MSHPDSLHDLVDALSDRSISDEQVRRLNELIENDADARRGFLNLMRVEAELGALHQPLASVAFAEAALSVDPAEAPTPASRVARPRSFRFSNSPGRSPPRSP